MHSHAAVQIMIVDDGDVAVTDGNGTVKSWLPWSFRPGRSTRCPPPRAARGRAIYVDSTTGMGRRIRPPVSEHGGVADWSDRGGPQ